MNDKFARLKAIANGEANSPAMPTNWTHEVDKPLIGTIKGFGQFQHDRYGTQETVTVETEDGELVSAILTPYLVDGMHRQHAEENDLVLIQFLGKEKSPHGNNYFNKFNLVVEKAS